MQKNMLKTFLQDIAVALCKKRLKEKQLILEKWEHFENWQKRPPSKDIAFAKWSLGQKLKMQKNMLKTFPQDIAVGDLKDFATEFSTKKTTSSPIDDDLLKNIEALINNKLYKETD